MPFLLFKPVKIPLETLHTRPSGFKLMNTIGMNIFITHDKFYLNFYYLYRVNEVKLNG